MVALLWHKTWWVFVALGLWVVGILIVKYTIYRFRNVQ